MIAIIHYVQRGNLICTLEIMVKSALQERRLQYSEPRSYIQKDGVAKDLLRKQFQKYKSCERKYSVSIWTYHF